MDEQNREDEMTATTELGTTETGTTETRTTETGTTPTTPVAPKAPARALRVGALVWGLIVAAIAAGMLAIANGAVFDVELSVILLLAAAGLVLLIGTVARARRRA